MSASREDPLRAMQEDQGPETDRENNAKEKDTQHSSTVKIRASQDKMFKELANMNEE